MRRVQSYLTLGLLVLAGCTHTRWPWIGPNSDPRLPVDPKHVPTSADLVTYLNSNAERLKTLKCEELQLTCYVGLQQVSLRGRLVAEQPRNFRLGADLAGAREVDLGSNSEEFWYWIKRGDNVQIRCAYKDLEQGNVKRMPFPFHPEVILEALGMANFGPPTRYQVVPEGDRLKLVERGLRSPQGKPIRKMIVFNRRPTTAPNPQVTDFILIDDQTDKVICSAHVRRVQLAPQTNGMLPRDLDLNWPEGRLKLSLRLDQVTCNFDIPPGSPAFVRSPMPGIPTYDLASGRLEGTPNSIQRVRGKN